jgi:hypothetical protein
MVSLFSGFPKGVVSFLSIPGLVGNYHLRLQTGCHDLAETEKPITGIAYEGGFGRPLDFPRFWSWGTLTRRNSWR